MKYFSPIAAGCFFIFSLQAQDKTVMAFPITDYIIEKDSVTIVQVVYPKELRSGKGADGNIEKVYTSTDTAVSIVALGAVSSSRETTCILVFVKDISNSLLRVT